MIIITPEIDLIQFFLARNGINNENFYNSYIYLLNFHAT